MTEKQTINGKEVWIEVNSYHMERANPNIIPTEYFTATCYGHEPGTSGAGGQLIYGEDGKLKLFESPVEALSFARKFMEKQA